MADLSDEAFAAIPEITSWLHEQATDGGYRLKVTRDGLGAAATILSNALTARVNNERELARMNQPSAPADTQVDVYIPGGRECSALPEGHKHCTHGHTEGCTALGTCDVR